MTIPSSFFEKLLRLLEAFLKCVWMGYWHFGEHPRFILWCIKLNTCFCIYEFQLNRSKRKKQIRDSISTGKGCCPAWLENCTSAFSGNRNQISPQINTCTKPKSDAGQTVPLRADKLCNSGIKSMTNGGDDPHCCLWHCSLSLPILPRSLAIGYWLCPEVGLVQMVWLLPDCAATGPLNTSQSLCGCGDQTS